jgi:hypothetical protein
LRDIAVKTAERQSATLSHLARRRRQQISSECMAALIAWLPIVRVDDLVKDGAKRRRLWRSNILDKIINTNRDAVQAIKAAFSIASKPPICTMPQSDY